MVQASHSALDHVVKRLWTTAPELGHRTWPPTILHPKILQRCRLTTLTRLTRLHWIQWGVQWCSHRFFLCLVSGKHPPKMLLMTLNFLVRDGPVGHYQWGIGNLFTDVAAGYSVCGNGCLYHAPLAAHNAWLGPAVELPVFSLQFSVHSMSAHTCLVMRAGPKV